MVCGALSAAKRHNAMSGDTQPPLHWRVSVISHGHGLAIAPVLKDLHKQLQDQSYEIVLTQNIDEPEDVTTHLPPAVLEHLVIRKNTHAKGFGANHNAALMQDRTAQFVAMVDPELQLPSAIFQPLAAKLAQPDCGIVSPQAITPQGQLEDNARPLFTPGRLLRRYMLGRRNDSRRVLKQQNQQIDWLAGLFLAIRGEVFQQLGGFDTRYFMYCEDIDLCLRAQNHGLSCQLIPQLQVIHPPRRGTFRSLRHLSWHIRSLLRLWTSKAYRQFKRRARKA